MLDLTQRRTEGPATVAAMTIKRSGRPDNALALRMDLTVPIDTDEAAAVFDQVVPGTAALFQRRGAGSEDRARLNRSPSNMTVVAAFREDADDDEPLVSVMATVVRLSFIAAPKAVVAQYQIAMVVESSLLAVLAHHLGRQVEVSLATSQQVLPFASSPPVAAAHPYEVLVLSFETEASGAEQVVYGFGAVVDQDDEGYQIDDFGVEVYVDRSCVIACVPIIVPKGVQRTYEVRSKALGRTPTWRELIPAIGMQWAESAESGEPIQLRDGHVRAVLGMDAEGSA